MNGLKELSRLSSNRITLRAVNFQTVIKFLSGSSKSNHGVMGVHLQEDVNRIEYTNPTENHHSSSISLSAMKEIIPERGLTKSNPAILNWEYQDIDRQKFGEYSYNRFEFPMLIPGTEEEFIFERVFNGLWLDKTVEILMHEPDRDSSGREYWMNLLLLSGDFFSNHLSEIELILLILNRIQPSGIMNVILDSSGLLSAVGSTALSKPILATQVLESSAFLHLGTVIAPAGYRKSGTPVMHFEYRLANNQLIEDEVCSGEIKRFELPIGEKVDVHLHAYKGIDIGFGRNGLGGKIKATGGQNGLIVDARGRPVPLSKTKDKKREQIEGWKRSLESEIF